MLTLADLGMLNTCYIGWFLIYHNINEEYMYLNYRQDSTWNNGFKKQ